MAADGRRPTRHMRESSVPTLWRRIDAAERDRARRADQIAASGARLGVGPGDLPAQGAGPGRETRFGEGAELRHARSVRLVRLAIARLRDQGDDVLANADVVDATKDVDEEQGEDGRGRGVSLSVLYHNGECADLLADARGVPRRPHVPWRIRRVGRKRLPQVAADAEAGAAAASAELHGLNERILREETDARREAVLALRREADAPPPAAAGGMKAGRSGTAGGKRRGGRRLP